MGTPFLPFTTERLTLRRLEPDDAATFAEYRSDPDIARYQSWSAPYPLDAARRLIDGQSLLTGPTAGDWIQIGVEHDGELVGDVAVEVSGDGQRATLGYTITARRHGQGFATEAVGAVVERLFDVLDVHRVEATLHPSNVASARVVEHLGFRYEGTAVSSVLEDGEWTDDERYALTVEQRATWRDRPHGTPDEVRLVPITPQLARAVLDLETHRTQRRFVAPMAASFADALFPEVVDGAPVVPWMRAIEADGEVAGFMMLAERTDAHPAAYLWRLLIDRRHQRRGIGTLAMRQLADELRGDGHTELLTSWVPGPGGPEPLYRRLGFVPTGEMDDDEVVARLTL